MAPVLQLYGLSPEEGRKLTDQQADALYQSAYQAYLDTVGTAALRGSDPRAAFTNEISVSSAKLPRHPAAAAGRGPAERAGHAPQALALSVTEDEGALRQRLVKLTPAQRQLLWEKLGAAAAERDLTAESPQAREAGAGACALSFAQERFWLADRLQPGSPSAQHRAGAAAERRAGHPGAGPQPGRDRPPP